MFQGRGGAAAAASSSSAARYITISLLVDPRQPIGMLSAAHVFEQEWDFAFFSFLFILPFEQNSGFMQ